MVALLPSAAHAAYTFSNVTSTSFTVNFVSNSPGGDASFGSTTDTWQCLVYESTGGQSVVGNYNGIAASVHSVSATGLQPNQTYIVECNDQTTLRVYQSGTTVQTLNAAPAFTLSSSSGLNLDVATNAYIVYTDSLTQDQYRANFSSFNHHCTSCKFADCSNGRHAFHL